MITVTADTFALRNPFTISRGTKTEARVITARVARNGYAGHGEGVPYPRYGQTVEDAIAAILALPDTITHAMAFAVFTHLPLAHLAHGLARIRAAFRALDWVMFTVFVAPDDQFDQPFRQPDGVVTHPGRAPWHHRLGDVLRTAQAAGFHPETLPTELPRGQLLICATPTISG